MYLMFKIASQNANKIIMFFLNETRSHQVALGIYTIPLPMSEVSI